jgi:hypothetical protein
MAAGLGRGRPSALPEEDVAEPRMRGAAVRGLARKSEEKGEKVELGVRHGVSPRLFDR